jgi:hypothetical protein
VVLPVLKKGWNAKKGGVMDLALSDEELEFLESTLERRQRELLNEIAHTDHREFKEGLLRNEKLVDSLLSRLRKTAVQESHR